MYFDSLARLLSDNLHQFHYMWACTAGLHQIEVPVYPETIQRESKRGLPYLGSGAPLAHYKSETCRFFVGRGTSRLIGRTRHRGLRRLRPAESKRIDECVWCYYMRMVQRRFWQKLVEQNWRERSVVWLAGVRRVGKTFLCQSLDDIEYFDCELPRTRRMMEDAQAFLEGLGKRRIVLDEVHRLPNPSELLKIAADHYPNIRVLATGSSTLGASAKFKDTLAGRKRNVWLTPMCLEDLKDAKHIDFRHRFLRGGLPPFFLAESFPERDVQEWVDAYWVKIFKNCSAWRGARRFRDLMNC